MFFCCSKSFLDKSELESAVYLACIGLVNVCQKHQNKTQDLTALILKVNSMYNKVSNDIIEWMLLLFSCG